MPPDADLLRRVACGRETEGDRAVLANCLRAYLADGAPAGGLDAALGLAGPAGTPPWWRAQRLAIRDAALRALAARFHAGRSVARQAEGIHRALAVYAASAWRLDRLLTAPPARYVGTAREMYFDALRACDAVPSARTIRRALRP